MAPETVRRALSFFSTYEPNLDIDISEGLSVVDAGNVDVVHTDLLTSFHRIELVVSNILENASNLAVIGGDHGNTYPCVKGLCNVTKGRVGIVMLDAHYDVRISHHDELSSGTPFRKVLEEIPGSPVRPENIAEIGVGGWHNAVKYSQYVKEKGIKVFTAREVRERGMKEVVNEALDVAKDGTDAVYLSLDIDGLDFAFAPGTGAPTPGGLSSAEYLDAVYDVGKDKMTRVIDIMEISPLLDVHDLTSILGASLLLQFLGAVKQRKTSPAT